MDNAAIVSRDLMKMMKRAVCFLALAALLMTAGALVCGPAQAEAADLVFTVSVSPDSLVTEDMVRVKMYIENKSSDDMTSISVMDLDGVPHGFGNLGPGENRTGYIELFVSDARLGKPYALTISWQQNGSEFSKSASFTVNKAFPRPDLEFTRTLSRERVEVGGKVELLYEVTNTGNVPLENLIISDPLVGVVGNKPRIMPGETAAFSANPTILSNTESVPKVTYLYGGQPYEKVLPSSRISLTQSRVEMTLAADRDSVNQGDTVKLTCTIQNNADKEITKLSVTDDALGNVYKANSLGAGQKITFTVEAVMENPSDFLFRLSYRTAEDEMLQSDAFLSVGVEGMDLKPIQLRIDAASDITSLTKPQEVHFTIEVFNDGEVPVTDVVVNERQHGLVGSAGMIGAGQSTVFRVTLTPQTTQDYSFTVSARDSMGRGVTAASMPVMITVGAPPTVAPDTTPMPAPDIFGLNKLTSFDFGRFFSSVGILLVVLVVLYIIAALILGASKGFAYVYEGQYRNNEEYDDDYEDDEEYEEYDEDE